MGITLLLPVLAAVAPTANAQAFMLAYVENLAKHARGYSDDSKEDSHELNNNTSVTVDATTLKPVRASDFSQSTMDIITIIWYVSTFLALAAFFFLMACSDRRRCNDQPRTVASSTDNQIPSLTPTPSYTEFAPPSYETVMKMQHTASVFVIPVGTSSSSFEKDQQNVTTSNPSTPTINFYIVNELEK